MKFFTSIITLVALVSSAEACQCISAGGVNDAATQNCCRQVNGRPEGNQCPANQIAQDLSKFASCCRAYGTRSDCRCPVGCARKELAAKNKAQGMSEPTDEDVLALMASYAE